MIIGYICRNAPSTPYLALRPTRPNITQGPRPPKPAPKTAPPLATEPTPPEA
ncbi:unnamed protein product [Laminaria digitata]